MVKNNIVFFLIACLAVAYAAMHLSFVLALPPASIDTALNTAFKVQLSLTEGKGAASPDWQSRILFPYLVKLTNVLVKGPAAVLFIDEAICAFFSFLFFFLLAKKMLGSDKAAGLAVIIFLAYLPFVFQFPLHYGVILMLGFFCFPIYLLLEGKNTAYPWAVALASLQRPDLALATVFFKALKDWPEKRLKGLWLNGLIMLIPIVVCYFISFCFRLNYQALYFNQMLARLIYNLSPLNLAFVFASFLPLSLLAIFYFREFDQTIKIAILSLLPYIVMVFLFGNFQEPRLFYPLIAMIAIAIAKKYYLFLTGKSVQELKV